MKVGRNIRHQIRRYVIDDKRDIKIVATPVDVGGQGVAAVEESGYIG